MVYLAAGGWWLNLASVTISIFSLVLYIAFAHLLPKDVYGNYQYLLSIFAIAGTFTLSGMNSAVSQSVARGYDGILKASIGIQLRWGLIPLVGALVGALYYALQGNYLLAGGFAIIGALTPIINTYNTYVSFLIGKKDFYRVFLYNLLTNIPFYAALILVSFFFKQALLLLAANLCVNAIMLVVLYRRTLNVYKPNDRVEEEALTYGKHLSVMGLFGALVGQADNILVFHYLGAVDLALYAFATAIPDRLANFFKFIPLTAMPKFSEKSDEEIRASLGPKLVKLTLAGLLGAGVYALLALPFFRVFFPQYETSVAYSMLYAFTMLGVAGNVAVSALIAQKHTRKLYIYNTAAPLAQLGLQFAGILFFGLWGLVGAKTLSTLLTSLFAVMLFMRQRAPSQTDN